jgi:ABC-type antimicrobial peptide transport system permease subunit
MAVYLPLAQVPDAVPSVVYIRPKTDARSFLPQALALVQNVRRDLPAARGVLLRDVVDPEFRPWRLGTTVFSAFAAVALMITAIGLYGVVAASTMARRKEIGIRMALGARWSHVTGVVAGDNLASVGSGLLAGGVLAAVASRWLGTVLYQTSPADPTVVLQTAGVLLLMSAIAVAVPTVRALRTNPVTVLRVE